MIRNPLASLAALSDAHRFISDAWAILRARSEIHIGELHGSLFHRRCNAPEKSVAQWYDMQGTLQGMTKFPGRSWCDLILRPGHTPQSEKIIAWAKWECRRGSRKPPALIEGIPTTYQNPLQEPIDAKRPCNRMATTRRFESLRCVGSASLVLLDGGSRRRAVGGQAAFPRVHNRDS
jgi:hypothetical protein